MMVTHTDCFRYRLFGLEGRAGWGSGTRVDHGGGGLGAWKVEAGVNGELWLGHSVCYHTAAFTGRK